MKKTISILVMAVLAAALVTGLSACTIEVKTGGRDHQTYTIDLEEFVSDIGEKGQEFMEGISTFLEGVGQGISSGKQSKPNLFDEIGSEIRDSFPGVEEEIPDQSSQVFENPDLIESILNSELPEELFSDPEFIESIMNSEEYQDLISAFQDSNGLFEAFADSFGAQSQGAQSAQESPESLDGEDSAADIDTGVDSEDSGKDNVLDVKN